MSRENEVILDVQNLKNISLSVAGSLQEPLDT